MNEYEYELTVIMNGADDYIVIAIRNHDELEIFRNNFSCGKIVYTKLISYELDISTVEDWS